MMLPHEIVGSFYNFQHVDLFQKMIGRPGVSWRQRVKCKALESSRPVRPQNMLVNLAPEALSRFWECEKNTELFRQNPVLQELYVIRMWAPEPAFSRKWWAIQTQVNSCYYGRMVCALLKNSVACCTGKYA